MHARPSIAPRNIRTIFISDCHLGCKYAQAQSLLAFLERHQPQFLYLVGDVIDGWRLKRAWHWNPVYNRILRRLHELAVGGTQLCYAPGNHDAFLRNFLADFGLLRIADEFVHLGADGRRHLILHGDQFDNIEIRSQWLSIVGAFAYDMLVAGNGLVNRLRRACGFIDWPFSVALKRCVKQVVTFVSNFERRLAQYAMDRGCDVVVCGHVHTPGLHDEYGITYGNTGDWVENRSALVEYDDGTLEIVHLTEDGREATDPRHPPQISFARPAEMTAAAAVPQSSAQTVELIK